MELLVVMIILGVLCAVAIPGYMKTVEKRRGELCVENIRMIVAAEKIYYTKNGNIWPNAGSIFPSVTAINSTLEIEIHDNYFSYEIIRWDSGDPPGLTIIGTRNDGTGNFIDRGTPNNIFNPISGPGGWNWVGSWFDEYGGKPTD